MSRRKLSQAQLFALIFDELASRLGDTLPTIDLLRASVIAKRLLDRGAIERVIVIAPRREVVRQWGEDYKAITGRDMTKVTGADGDVDDFGDDLCATWAAIQALSEPFQYICQTYRTLVITPVRNGSSRSR